MVKYICRRRLLDGDTWYNPGEEFPVKPYHKLSGLLGMGWLEKVEDGQATPVRPSPSVATKPVQTVPDDIGSLSKAELVELAADLGVEVQGTGSDGFVLKSDLQNAIKAHQDDA